MKCVKDCLKQIRNIFVFKLPSFTTISDVFTINTCKLIFALRSPFVVWRFVHKRTPSSIHHSNSVLYKENKISQQVYRFDLNFRSTPQLLINLYKFTKNTIISLFVGALFIFYCFVVFHLSFLKLVSFWIVVLLITYWLLSGFNFFLKRYRFGKFTSAIQRFWKRAFMCFWMIEGFLFVLFVYYMLNSSSEPIFMYDQAALYTNQLLSWKIFLVVSVFTVTAINILVMGLISFNYYNFRRNLLVSSYITLFLLFTLFTESYQFYYILNFYDDSVWLFNEDDNLWELEHDTPRTRNKNHYLTLCLVAKFWHYIFIFASWVFFLMKTLEIGRFKYTFFSLNLQNLIIFYIMSWIFMYNWVKWIFRRFGDSPYYWFFVSNREILTSSILSDLSQIVQNISSYAITFFSVRTNCYNLDFFYFFISTDKIFDRGFLLKNYFIMELAC